MIVGWLQSRKMSLFGGIGQSLVNVSRGWSRQQESALEYPLVGATIIRKSAVPVHQHDG